MKELANNFHKIFPYFVFILILFIMNLQAIGSLDGFESSSCIQITEQDTSIEFKANPNGAWKFGAFPIIFYSDETRLAGGAGVMAVHKTDAKMHSSSLLVIGFYTQNKQYVIEAAPELYFKRDNFKFSGGIAFLHYPDKFYGIGNNTRADDEEDYTSRQLQFNPIIQKKIFQKLYMGLQYNFVHAKFTETEAGNLLAKGNIFGSEGGSASGIGIFATYDSRDSNLYPTKGSYHQFSAITYESGFGSDFMFNSYLLDLRHYRQIFSKHILAFQGVYGVITGNPPFNLLNQVGIFLRGYYQSRFQDNNLLALQAEYRLPLFWRFGLAGFAGCGQVAHEIEYFSFKELKPSAGFGIRFSLIPEQKVNVRIDFGIGKDDSSLDIALMELF